MSRWSLDHEVLIAGQSDLTGKRAEPNGAGRCARDVEEGLARFRVEVAVVLLRPAVAAVVGKAGTVAIGTRRST